MSAKKGIFSLAIVAMLLASLLAPATIVAQESQPVLPTSFYGDVAVNDIPVPIDTVITGRIVDVLGSPGEGSITVTEEGKYGVPGLGDKLSVETDSTQDLGKEIEFYVKLPGWTEAKKADQTATYDSDVHELNLTVTGDVDPPTVGIDIPDYINIANVEAVAVTITSDEDGTYTYTISDGTVELTDTGAIGAGVPVEFSLDLSTLADGMITADASVEDAAGNIGEAPQATATKDIVAPTVTIDAVTTPTNVATQTLSGTMEEGATVALTSAEATFGDVSYPTTTTWSCDVSLVEDSNVITATATDAAGNTATAEATIELDTVAPTVTIDAVTTPTNVATQTLTGTMEEGATVALSSATATFGDVSYPTATTWSCEVTLAEGLNLITATATDAAGNEGTAQATIVLDTEAPAVESTSPVTGPGYRGPGGGEHLTCNR